AADRYSAEIHQVSRLSSNSSSSLFFSSSSSGCSKLWYLSLTIFLLPHMVSALCIYTGLRPSSAALQKKTHTKCGPHGNERQVTILFLFLCRVTLPHLHAHSVVPLVTRCTRQLPHSDSSSTRA